VEVTELNNNKCLKPGVWNNATIININITFHT